jgi:TrmH family RNA methyltransferase
VDLTGSVAIALGAETTGLSASWSSDVTGVRLPMLGVADSLNVSVAAAVLLYEARRQRGARA